MSVSVTGSFGFNTESWSIVVHGGAGSRTAQDASQFEAGCAQAAAAGAAVLAAGGRALDAVEASVRALEDNRLFNAGTGAALTEDGAVELDAAIMCGATLRAGAVCALPPFRNPIAIARAVLEHGVHVLYAGDGAAVFAEQAGFVRESPESLITEASRAGLARWKATHAPVEPHGTVGAVARDRSGSVAAATSTGGVTGKRHGRVGDSPILGAGTYADDESGAASATGPGEGILRVTLSAQLCAALRAGVGAEQACQNSLETLLRRVATRAGVIAVGKDGSLGLARSTEWMPWAAAWSDGLRSGT